MNILFSSSDSDETEPRLPSVLLNEHDPTEKVPLVELTQRDPDLPEDNFASAAHFQAALSPDISTMPTLPEIIPDISMQPTLAGAYPDISTLPTSAGAYPNLPAKLSAPVISTMFSGAPPPPQPLSEGPFEWYKHQDPGKRLWLGGGAIALLLTIIGYLFLLVALNHVPAPTIVTPYATPAITSIKHLTSTPTSPFIGLIPVTPTQGPANTSIPTQITTPSANPTQPPSNPTQPPTHPTPTAL